MTEKTNWDFIDKRKGVEPKKKSEDELGTGGLSIDELIKQMQDGSETQKREIARQEYEKVKNAAEKFRIEHGIQKSKEELAQEDAILRRKFGI
ncbi:MAG: hypothetical protein WA060_00655 [Minisyncoccia bacterium]